MEDESVRVLITGSRTWDDALIIRRALLPYREYEHCTLVSGHCRKGADALCEALGEELHFTIERHPAEWGKYGRAAGFIRNEKMVTLGADVCLAFIRDRSRGASHCARLARVRGIPIRVWRMS